MATIPAPGERASSGTGSPRRAAPSIMSIRRNFASVHPVPRGSRATSSWSIFVNTSYSCPSTRVRSGWRFGFGPGRRPLFPAFPTIGRTYVQRGFQARVFAWTRESMEGSLLRWSLVRGTASGAITPTLEVAHAQRFAWSSIVARDRRERSPREPQMRRRAPDASFPLRDRGPMHDGLQRPPRQCLAASQRPFRFHACSPRLSVPMRCSMERQLGRIPATIVDVAATLRARV